MKVLRALSLLVCLSYSAVAEDLNSPTPSPTPYVNPIPRTGPFWRREQYERRRALGNEVEANRDARAQARADRRATKKAEAEAKVAANARERAQRQVDKQSRLETTKATPHPTSDLMKRMGFSDQEIAAQKALEEPAKPEVTPGPSPTNSSDAKPSHSQPPTASPDSH